MLRIRANEALAAYEGMRWEGIPWKVKALAALAYPRMARIAIGAWFRQVTAVPGDRFAEAQRDVEVEVVEVKPRRVRVEVRSGQFLAAGIGWNDPLPANVVRSYEDRTRSPLGWWL